MAQMTLLEIVQSTLSALDFDDVNSIGDTVESEQVTKIAKEVFLEFNSRDDWPAKERVMQLESVSDVTRPMLLRIPDKVEEIRQLYYEATETGDTSRKMRELTLLEPRVFVQKIFTRRTSESNVTAYNIGTGVDLFIITDEPPTYYTSFDDEYVVCDSFNQAEESTLQSSNSSANVILEPTWTETDIAVPDMPGKYFPAYLARVKAKCFFYYKDTSSPLDLQEDTVGTSRLKQHSRRTNQIKGRKNYGRPGAR